MGKSTISMVIFNSYFDITRGYLNEEEIGILGEVFLDTLKKIWPMNLQLQATSGTQGI